MEILNTKQKIRYRTQLSETEISERLHDLLNIKQQNTPHVFGGNFQQEQFEIYSTNTSLSLTPIVRGTLSNEELILNLKPSKQFNLAVSIMTILTIGLIFSLILDINSSWYFLPIQVLFFLTLVNFEGLRNYRNILKTLERRLELTDKKIVLFLCFSIL